MGRSNSESLVKGQGSPLRKAISRRERSPVQFRSSKAENSSERKRSPKRPRSRSPVYHLPVRKKPSSLHKSPKYRTSPSTTSHYPVRQKPSGRSRSPKPAPSRSPTPISPIKMKPSSRSRSSKQGKSRSSVSRSPEKVNLSSLAKSSVSGRSNSPIARSPSPRSKRLKRGKVERDVEKGGEKEPDKNHGRNSDRATHKERDYDRALPIQRSDKIQGRDAIDNGSSKSRHRLSSSPNDNRPRAQQWSRSPSVTDDRARDERAYSRNAEQGNSDSDSLAKLKAAEDTLKAKEKQKPSFELSGKLAAETNRYRASQFLEFFSLRNLGPETYRMHMATDIETVEQRLKSFLGQVQTESGILERIVYKHKNQHRRCSYFQYVLKVRRDLNLLKSVNLEEILDTSFLVINGDKPRQKVQLLESLKRRRSDGGKYSFLERLLGAARLLSQMVEPLLRAATKISTLLAQSFFMKFSLTTLAVLARIRVLVQQVLVDAVLVYNHVSSLSQREHTIKLNQEGFEVFREYYPRKLEATVTLDCIWQIDKYVLVERTDENESKSQEKNDREDVLIQPSNIQYDNIEAFLGDESDLINFELVSAEPIDGEESSANHFEKHAQNDSHSAGSSCLNLVSHKSETSGEKLMEDGSLSASCSTALVNPVKHKILTKKSVAFVSVNPRRTPSTANQSEVQLRGTGKSVDDHCCKSQE